MTTEVTGPQIDELKRIRRVADMLCTCHAVLRDKFFRTALLADILTLGLSTWILALAFVAPTMAVRLAPFGWDSAVWMGVLSAGTFFLTLLQLKADWKGRSDSHKRSLVLYAEVKREIGYLLAAQEVDEISYTRALARYDLASAAGVEVPERYFLKLKKKHKLKLLISKHLDDQPATSLLLFQIRLWWVDNIRGRRN